MSKPVVTPQTAVFLPDGGPGVGLGHMLRCHSLAEAMSKDGWRCALALKAGCRDLMASSSDRDIALVEAPDGAGWTAASLDRQWPAGVDLAVVDDYGCDIEYEAALSKWASRTMVVDDLFDREHDCHTLLCAAPPAGRANPGAVQETLLGPSYALLNQNFWRARLKKMLNDAPPNAPKVVVVNLGGTRQEKVLRTILDGLMRCDEAMEIHLISQIADQIAGDYSRHAPRISIHPLLFSNTMAALLASADLAIGAGGVSAWERAALLTPSIVVEIAANQQRTIELLEEADAALVFRGDQLTADDIARAATTILGAVSGETGRRESMARRAAVMTDALGVRRVMLALRPEAAVDGAPVSLRPARQDDGAQIFAWQIAPETRRFANNPEPPRREDHIRWFDQKRADPKCVFSIIEYKGEPAGVVRLDIVSNEGVAAAITSINVAPTGTRKGVGVAALRAARRLTPELRLLAEIDPANEASLRLFKKAGYHRRDSRWHVSEARCIEPQIRAVDK